CEMRVCSRPTCSARTRRSAATGRARRLEERGDWKSAVASAAAVANRRGQELERGLGFGIRPTDSGRVHVLVAPAMPTVNTDEKGTNLLGNTKPALFRSDRDSFAFFYGDKAPGDDGLGGMRKGIVVYNSEVGAKSFGFSTF